ncbi:MAG: DUF2783 domain-containing protein [Rhizobiaceae bacterium]
MTKERVLGEDHLGANGDAFYELLMKAHEGLAEEESQALNIRLILLMANQIGDLESLTTIVQEAAKRKT